MSQVSDVITEVRNRMVDATDVSYESDMLINFVSQAQRDLASTTACCRQHVEYTNTSDGATSIPFTSFLGAGSGILLAMYRLDYEYEFLPFAPTYEEVDFKNVSTSTVPTAWTVFDEHTDAVQSVYFNAALSTNVNFTGYFSYIPPALTGVSNTLQVPDKWRHALIPYVEYLCHKQDRDGGLANLAWAEYENLRRTVASANQAYLTHGGAT